MRQPSQPSLEPYEGTALLDMEDVHFTFTFFKPWTYELALKEPGALLELHLTMIIISFLFPELFV